MHRSLSAAILGLGVACSGAPSETPARGATLASFVGEWQSVTPSYEFIRLTLLSLSSDPHALGARLTFSGVAWDGRGQIDGDSVVAQMSPRGTAMVTSTVVMHASDARTLRLYARSGNATAFTLTLVRDE
jgi:hypothetical protein